MRQKSRIRWLAEGDLNTRFFFSSVIAHLSRNIIYFLLDGQNQRISDQFLMKSMTLNFYKSLLGTHSIGVTPYSVEEIQELHPYRCAPDLINTLSAIPSDTEIKAAVFSLPRNKAPGPDGFTVDFFISSWDLVGQDLIKAVRHFFNTSDMLRQVNATVITLIPKFPGASSLKDFRPISLCNTVYKVISRLLSARLKLLAPLAIQNNQVGFVKGRLLCENVLLASELVKDFDKPGPTRRGCLQIDISKAFDNLNWAFVLNILQAFGLPQVFIEWISSCISTPHYSICFNGELVGFFPGKKGLRQGDPLSSTLFVLAMDILSKNLDKAARSQLFIPHPTCLNPLVTHLSFADDVLIFFDGTESSLQGILNVLNGFHRVSGLAINLAKSSLFLDGNNSILTQQLATRFHISHGALPVKYLGLPLLPRKPQPLDYQPLIDKVLARITGWTVRHLSFAGRLQLIQSVILGIINFWGAVFPLPNACLEKLEQICKAFLWNGDTSHARGAKVSWETICTPKSAGGLGLRRLAGVINVFGLKLIWLLFSKQGSLWVAWVKNNLIRNKIFWTAEFQNCGSWIWRKLLKLRNIARPRLHCHIESGRDASFWIDNWTGYGPLINLTGDIGPMVTGISLSSSVASAASNGGWSLPRGRHRVVRLLRQKLTQAPPDSSNSHHDTYHWQNDPNDAPGLFLASRTWASLHPSPPSVPWYKSVWFKDRIPKQAFIVWVLMWNRLSTRDKLISWGISVPPDCVLCGTLHETSYHLFFECAYSLEVWNSFFHHPSLSPPVSYTAALDWLRSCSSNPKLKTICHLLYQSTIYTLWRERNSRMHAGPSKPPHVIRKDIITLLRAKLAGLDQAAARSRGRRLTTTDQSQDTFLSNWFTYIQI